MYVYLYQLFHQTNNTVFEQEYEKRFHGYGTIHVPMQIKLLKSSQSFPLFIVNTQSLLLKFDRINRQDTAIRELMAQLPSIAQHNFIHQQLIDEMFNTNDLEGVRSTREEMVESTRQVLNQPSKQVRFKSMINSYSKLLSEEFISMEEPADVRRIYDYLVADEMDKEEHRLDGELFRKDMTYVYKESGTGKIIHKGVTPEQAITSHMHGLINFLNGHDLPLLYRIAITHYYFGYIHPFYDGNGRTSRFISSLYLRKEFNPLTALSLSKGCNHNRKDYLDAFEKTNSFMNRGELTYFCETFFAIIIDSQIDIINELKERKLMLEHMLEVIEKDPEIKNELQQSILFILTQDYYFAGTGEGMLKQDFISITGKSLYTLNKELEDLETKGLITSKGKRPVHYYLNEAYFNLA
ncbi:Fic family protein [Domibacillus mangrovi]|uniref:Fido domain-containing protein n=1 Tax=Domibacillus mangrovi TaxID=1714354 RepID=A0A1Q5P2C9_9BACI|nr:Fic family protein [Domibacillus mangrovi]OKL36348.1 hypothetical protein BLL40_10660 [Domibacillus mangrovi]